MTVCTSLKIRIIIETLLLRLKNVHKSTMIQSEITDIT